MLRAWSCRWPCSSTSVISINVCFDSYIRYLMFYEYSLIGFVSESKMRHAVFDLPGENVTQQAGGSCGNASEFITLQWPSSISNSSNNMTIKFMKNETDNKFTLTEMNFYIVMDSNFPDSNSNNFSIYHYLIRSRCISSIFLFQWTAPRCSTTTIQCSRFRHWKVIVVQRTKSSLYNQLMRLRTRQYPSKICKFKRLPLIKDRRLHTVLFRTYFSRNLYWMLTIFVWNFSRRLRLRRRSRYRADRSRMCSRRFSPCRSRHVFGGSSQPTSSRLPLDVNN